MSSLFTVILLLYLLAYILEFNHYNGLGSGDSSPLVSPAAGRMLVLPSGRPLSCMHVFTFVLQVRGLVYTVDLLVSIGEPTQTEMANTREGKYVYMEDLLALDACCPTEPPPIDISGVIEPPSSCWGLEGLYG